MTGETREAPPTRFWWLSRPKYIAVLLREVSSIFILLYVFMYLELLARFHRGTGEYLRFLEALRSPPLMALGVAILLFTLYHTVTWFLLLPRVQPLRLGGLKLEGHRALAFNLVLMILASLIVTALILDPALIWRMGG